MSFLDDLRKILDQEPELSADRICTLLVDNYGGERVYIPRRRCVQEISRKDTPIQIMKREGVSRATAYRLARRNWVNRW